MPAVDVTALGATRKLVGFSRRTVEMEGGTIADLLRAMKTVDGGDLYANLVCEGKLRGDYAIVVDGLSLRADQLDMPLQGGEQVVTMAILYHLHGG
jgi:hypothetical protein